MPRTGYLADQPLSPQESLVLTLHADGLRSDEIARRIHTSQATVWAVMGHTRTKLRAASNEHAVAIAFRRKMIK